ncbi:Arf family guanine nucleotide exchange factor SYT1 NDAI_0A04930 [Naumovozyma dairenensis CBS 421]|uniref:SEC7 domain-containing protein n=1 Tax=Naumovozyma dairenensis (strain ATCC 10597 / BCRC 20456 / CBS 421 / NBRC 0211 / NRRL Y-12639) TaxID=1071378 RepID=G0W4B0_NAUDC|nr:hypothetical protein NDAI_0A04930 [Naumovozyma dairenensis CBS 421]CCD22648.1 hypothetical protein NDAI_0A04930 [Naumovozyma dairenensis CBS 421]
MNQSIASLIKLKLFQGSSPSPSYSSISSTDASKETTPSGNSIENTDKENENNQYNNDYTGIANVKKDENFHREKLSEIKAKKKTQKKENEASHLEDFAQTNLPKKFNDENVELASKPENNSDPMENTEKESRWRHGRFQRIRNKMNVLEKNLKNSNSNNTAKPPTSTQSSHLPHQRRHHHHQLIPNLHHRTGEREPIIKKTSLTEERRVNSQPTFNVATTLPLSPVKMFPEKFPQKGPEKESQSSTLSNISLNTFVPSSPIKLRQGKGNSEDSTSSSSIRFDDGNPGKIELKKNERKTTSIGRRRSKTVDASDYIKKSHVSSIPLIKEMERVEAIRQPHRSHSRSFSENRPLRKSQTLTSSMTMSPNNKIISKSPRSSSGSFTAPHWMNSSNPPISARRSSSIVNALTSFVNLRSTSASSTKPQFQSQLGRCSCMKTLDDLPTPPHYSADDSHESYLKKISKYGKFIGVILTKKDDEFQRKTLNYFLTNHFDFENDPIDVALRKILMFLELPKESQQIDRLLIEFSNVYYKEQRDHFKNKCAWKDENQVYFITFSLLMLHTDYFNPNNKNKMSKEDFVSLVHGDEYSGGNKIPLDILFYYYENIIAMESPKFDFSPIIPEVIINEESAMSTSADDHTEEEKKGFSLNEKMYSPLHLIKEKKLMSSEIQAFPPQSYSIINPTRPASNSISSYFSAPTSISSSTSTVYQDDIDIYFHILSDTLSEINMKHHVDKLCPENKVVDTKYNVPSQHRYDKYFSILNETKGGYLRISKSQLSKLPSFSIVNETHNNNNNMKGNNGKKNSDYYYLKIIQMGEINEFYTNKKLIFSNKNEWKSKKGILTTNGIILYEKKNVELGEPQIMRDDVSGTSNYIIDFKHVGNVSFISCNGLFAANNIDEFLQTGIIGLTEDSNDTGANSNTNANSSNTIDDLVKNNKGCILYLIGSQGKYIWKCDNKYETENWIDSINSMASFEGCNYNFGCLRNTITSFRKYEVKEKYDRLKKSKKDKLKKFIQIQKKLTLFEQSIPISLKTRNDMIISIKQLAVKMDWLLYEIKRNAIYISILKHIDEDYENILTESSSSLTNKSDVNSFAASIDESFIFHEQNLHRCISETESMFPNQSSENASLEFLTF